MKRIKYLTWVGLLFGKWNIFFFLTKFRKSKENWKGLKKVRSSDRLQILSIKSETNYATFTT